MPDTRAHRVSEKRARAMKEAQSAKIVDEVCAFVSLNTALARAVLSTVH